MVADPHKPLCDSDLSDTNEKPHDRWSGHGVNETVGRRFDNPLHHMPGSRAVQAFRRAQPLQARGFA